MSLPGIPGRMAFDSSSNWLYVVTTAGIVAVDTTTDTVKLTLTATGDAGAVVFRDVEVDPATHVVYADSGTRVYAFDGTAGGAPTATVDLASIAPNAAASVYGLAVDPAGKKLYAIVGGFNGSQVVGVLDTSTATPTLGPTVTLSDLTSNADGDGKSLVLDPQNHLLFACGFTFTVTGSAIAADTIDTTTNAVKGAQQKFTGSGTSLNCQAGPGWAALLTGPAFNQPAILEMLEPASVNLPANLNPTSFTSGTGGAGGVNWVTIYGVDDSTGQQVFTCIPFCGETQAGPPFTAPVGAPTQDFLRSATTGTQLSTAFDVWVTEVPSASDAGAQTSSVYRVHIDTVYLAPTLGDAGCCNDGGC